MGGSRGPFYEKRLLEGLAWHCKAGPESVPNGDGRPKKRWGLHCELPHGCRLPADELQARRHEWYAGLARSAPQRAAFAELAAAGGAVPFADPRRPEAFRAESRESRGRLRPVPQGKVQQ